MDIILKDSIRGTKKKVGVLLLRLTRTKKKSTSTSVVWRLSFKLVYGNRENACYSTSFSWPPFVSSSVISSSSSSDDDLLSSSFHGVPTSFEHDDHVSIGLSSSLNVVLWRFFFPDSFMFFTPQEHEVTLRERLRPLTENKKKGEIRLNSLWNNIYVHYKIGQKKRCLPALRWMWIVNIAAAASSTGCNGTWDYTEGGRS